MGAISAILVAEKKVSIISFSGQSLALLSEKSLNLGFIKSQAKACGYLSSRLLCFRTTQLPEFPTSPLLHNNHRLFGLSVILIGCDPNLLKKLHIVLIYIANNTYRDTWRE